MVRKGEYLERPVPFVGPAGALDGLYHRGRHGPPLLIVPPHPEAGGSMESTVIAELAWAVTRAGHPTFRFNHRGVGASAGVFNGIEGGLEDARAAADRVAPSGELALAGIGLGAAVAARLALERPERTPLVVLVSPDLDHLPPELAPPSTEVFIVLAADEDAVRKAALAARVEGRPAARMTVIPGSDRIFLKGLVELGRVVAEAISPVGIVSLDPG